MILAKSGGSGGSSRSSMTSCSSFKSGTPCSWLFLASTVRLWCGWSRSTRTSTFGHFFLSPFLTQKEGLSRLFKEETASRISWITHENTWDWIKVKRTQLKLWALSSWTEPNMKVSLSECQYRTETSTRFCTYGKPVRSSGTSTRSWALFKSFTCSSGSMAYRSFWTTTTRNWFTSAWALTCSTTS